MATKTVTAATVEVVRGNFVWQTPVSESFVVRSIETAGDFVWIKGDHPTQLGTINRFYRSTDSVRVVQ